MSFTPALDNLSLEQSIARFRGPATGRAGEEQVSCAESA
jgi:hypothetical protein